MKVVGLNPSKGERLKKNLNSNTTAVQQLALWHLVDIGLFKSLELKNKQTPFTFHFLSFFVEKRDIRSSCHNKIFSFALF